MELSIGLTILAIIGCLGAYGASKIGEVNRKYEAELKAKKLNSNH